MELFKGQSLLEFTEHFKTDLDSEEYLASLKWEKGYCCRKCGHKKYQVRKDFSRTCNICSDTESPTAGTLFHRLKFGLRKAFYICFEMSTTTKSLSASQVARRYEISRQTAHYFMQKVREAMKSRFIIRNNFVIRNYLLSLSPKNEYDTYRICYNK